MRVVVAGAGIGGLALAQGLMAAGIEVVVLERDAAVDARPQGYRIHLDPRARAALDDCLPPRLSAAVWATSTRLDPPLGFTVTTARLWPRRTTSLGPQLDSSVGGAAVDRLTLRSILSHGLGSVVRYDAQVVGFRRLGEGDGHGVEVLLRHGRTLTGDVLVGADGVGSAVRRQLMPDHAPSETGSTVTVGSTPLRRVEATLPEIARHGFVLARGPDTRLGLGLMRFATRPDELGLGLPARDDYVMWVLGRDGDTTPEGRTRLSRLYHPQLRAVVEAADPESVFVLAVRAASPPPDPIRGPVVLMGDAWAAQPPQGGTGASLALDGARVLLAELTRIEGARASIPEALARYAAALPAT